MGVKHSIGKPLTAKQQEIWNLCLPVQEGGSGKTYDEAGLVLGISGNVVRKTLVTCRKKMQVLANGPKRHHLLSEVKRFPEYTDPEAAAILVDSITDPGIRGKLHPIRKAIADSGLPERFGKALLKRLETRYLNVKTGIRALKTGEILQMLEEKLHLAGEYLDDHVMAEASARDLMLGMAALVEKRQLLRGEPTQIISTTDRQTLQELLPVLLAETQRRGLTVNGQSERMVESAPVDAVDAVVAETVSESSNA